MFLYRDFLVYVMDFFYGRQGTESIFVGWLPILKLIGF